MEPRSFRADRPQSLAELLPQHGALLDFLARTGCDVTLRPASVRRDGTSARMLGIRLPQHLRHRFDISRPIVALLARGELKFQALQEVQRVVRAAGDEVEPDVAFVVTPDVGAPQKIESWGGGLSALDVIPLVTTGDRRLRDAPLSEDLVALLEQTLFSRDLYDERTPVRGDHFFGRARELEALAACVTQGRHVGLFGLRKIGKTSLLYRVRDQLR